VAKLKNSRDYDDTLNDLLKDPERAAEYLNVHLEKEAGDTDEESDRFFLLALRHVARAHGVADIAERTKLGRESLYKALSADGNPKLTTLRALLEAMGLKLTIQPKKAA
jgi:probable addiction module antidote protein